MTLAEFWPQCLALLQTQLNAQPFQTHIAPLTVGEENGVWIVYAKNQFSTNLLRSQYGAIISEAAALLGDDLPALQFKVGVGTHYAPATLPEDSHSGEKTVESTTDFLENIPDDSSGSLKNPPTPSENTTTVSVNKRLSAQDILAERLHNLRAQSHQNTPAETAVKNPEKIEKSTPSAIEMEKHREAKQQKLEQTNLSADYTFDALVVGNGNQLVVAVAKAIAEKPGSANYNPFFVYGCTGLGKTHLAQAVAHDLLKRNPRARVHYIHSDAYVKTLMQTVRNQAWDAFKQKYLHYDLLIIDDIQFIAGKERTMEEFFFLFEHFYNHKQQIILTCDQLPSGLAAMDDRLKSRFSWGMTLQIEPPEQEMRVHILERKAQKAGMILDEDAALLIAQNVKKSVRDLEGALNRLVARCRFEKSIHITRELAESTLSDVIASNYKPITIELIIKTVADRYNISSRDILSKKRSRNLARPRQMAMTIAKELTKYSLKEIGEAFGGRDHTTVLHAIDTIKELCENDPNWQRDYNELQILIQH